jgi:hypothetical protein
VYSLDSLFKPHYVFWQIIFLSSGRVVYKMVFWSVTCVVILKNYSSAYTNQSGVGSLLYWIKMVCCFTDHFTWWQAGRQCSSRYYHLILYMKHKRMHVRMLWFSEKLPLQGYCSIYGMFYQVDFCSRIMWRSYIIIRKMGKLHTLWQGKSAYRM